MTGYCSGEPFLPLLHAKHSDHRRMCNRMDPHSTALGLRRGPGAHPALILSTWMLVPVMAASAAAFLRICPPPSRILPGTGPTLQRRGFCMGTSVRQRSAIVVRDGQWSNSGPHRLYVCILQGCSRAPGDGQVHAFWYQTVCSGLFQPCQIPCWTIWPHAA